MRRNGDLLEGAQRETLMPPATIIPVILSGGSGTRPWPMSRPERPKQFLPPTAAEPMLQPPSRNPTLRLRRNLPVPRLPWQRDDDT